jgi:hypothetical protein
MCTAVSAEDVKPASVCPVTGLATSLDAIEITKVSKRISATNRLTYTRTVYFVSWFFITYSPFNIYSTLNIYNILY